MRKIAWGMFVVCMGCPSPAPPPAPDSGGACEQACSWREDAGCNAHSHAACVKTCEDMLSGRITPCFAQAKTASEVLLCMGDCSK